MQFFTRFYWNLINMRLRINSTFDLILKNLIIGCNLCLTGLVEYSEKYYFGSSMEYNNTLCYLIVLQTIILLRIFNNPSYCFHRAFNSTKMAKGTRRTWPPDSNKSANKVSLTKRPKSTWTTKSEKWKRSVL